MEEDSSTIIFKIKSNNIPNNSFGFILDTICCFVSHFDYFYFYHNKRPGNKVAYALAHFQPYSVGSRMWFGDVLDHIAALAWKDVCTNSDSY